MIQYTHASPMGTSERRQIDYPEENCLKKDFRIQNVQYSTSRECRISVY